MLHHTWKRSEIDLIPIYTLTNDNHLWLLPGYAYLWQKYCGQVNTVVGFKPPSFALPHCCTFFSLGQQLPASKWSDGLLRLISKIKHPYFILMLEDYWLYDKVQWDKVKHLTELLTDDVLRVDLSGNRVSYKAAVEIADGIVETPPGTPYQMSYQAAIWHKKNLKKVLKKGENPWESEINGSERVGNLRVLGTKKKLFKYQPVWRSQQRRWQLDKMRTEDIVTLKAKGWLTPNRK